MTTWVANHFIAIQNRFPSTAYLYAIGFNIFVGVLQLCTKLLAGILHTNYILVVMGSLLVVTNTLVVNSSGGGPIYTPKFQTFKLVLTRSLLSGVWLIFNFYAVKNISLSIVNSISMTGPIWANFIEAVILKAPVKKENVIVAIVCLFGLLLITKPSFLFQSSQNSDSKVLFFSLLTLLAAFISSISLVICRGLRTLVTNFQALQYLFYVQSISNAVVMIFEGNETRQVKGFSWYAGFLLLTVCVVGYLAQIILFRALCLKPASEIMLFSYVLIVFAFLVDLFVFDESFDWMSLVGVIVIVSSLYFVMSH